MILCSITVEVELGRRIRNACAFGKAIEGWKDAMAMVVVHWEGRKLGKQWKVESRKWQGERMQELLAL